jgi:murein L,D-transpeptidase YafK
MRAVKLVVLVAILAGLAGCSKFKTYRGPEVTRVIVDKSDRRMWLMHHDEVLEVYAVDLGFAPQGHKQFEGDGKTPEGAYRIDRRNPNSRFHLSLGISYPNDTDRTFAASNGKPPGGDIFIHGASDLRGRNVGDWTEGCIAVTNREMEWIYAMVRDGTPIWIQP